MEHGKLIPKVIRRGQKCQYDVEEKQSGRVCSAKTLKFTLKLNDIASRQTEEYNRGGGGGGIGARGCTHLWQKQHYKTVGGERAVSRNQDAPFLKGGPSPDLLQGK